LATACGRWPFQLFDFAGRRGERSRHKDTKICYTEFMDDDQTSPAITDTQPSVSPEPVVESPQQNPEPESVPVENSPTPPNSPDLPNPPENPQPIPEEQTTQNVQQVSPEPVPQIEIPTLYFPFYGSVTPSLTFNQIPDDERIKQKFQEWSIVGHNGLDFPLTEGTEVLACDSGKIIQAGENGDYGVCVTIQHSWGQSVYAHLKETKVTVDQEVKTANLIGLSDTTGAAFGPHLHFTIKPNNANESNGYLGFVDPAPYLKNIISPPPIPSSPNPSIPSVPVEPEIKIEPVPEIPKPPESSQIPETPQNPQTSQIFTPNEAVGEVGPQVSEEEIQKQVSEKLALELASRRQKANETRKENRQGHLAAIEKLLGEKKEITNQDVQNLVHVSRTTAFDYLTTLVNSGKIKVEGKGRATVYKNIFG
jgi:murein DD-endopeptidase MepM/ murein hydrolase activator NlpD